MACLAPRRSSATEAYCGASWFGLRAITLTKRNVTKEFPSFCAPTRLLAQGIGRLLREGAGAREKIGAAIDEREHVGRLGRLRKPWLRRLFTANGATRGPSCDDSEPIGVEGGRRRPPTKVSSRRVGGRHCPPTKVPPPARRAARHPQTKVHQSSCWTTCRPNRSYAVNL